MIYTMNVHGQFATSLIEGEGNGRSLFFDLLEVHFQLVSSMEGEILA